LKCIGESMGFNLVVADDQTSYGYPAYIDGSISDCTSAEQNPADGVLSIKDGRVDSDSDGIKDVLDNCPYITNPNQADADGDCIGDVCDPEPEVYDSSVPDSYPPQGNGIGDACDCEGNFNCSQDQDVDGSDASTFKVDFGRSTFNRPCTNADLCNGDFSCNGNVDGSDAAKFKSDFGRSSFQNPCPICVNSGPWCSY
jgi:hypothetical protein